MLELTISLNDVLQIVQMYSTPSTIALISSFSYCRLFGQFYLKRETTLSAQAAHAAKQTQVGFFVQHPFHSSYSNFLLLLQFKKFQNMLMFVYSHWRVRRPVWLVSFFTFLERYANSQTWTEWKVKQTDIVMGDDVGSMIKNISMPIMSVPNPLSFAKCHWNLLYKHNYFLCLKYCIWSAVGLHYCGPQSLITAQVLFTLMFA